MESLSLCRELFDPRTPRAEENGFLRVLGTAVLYLALVLS